MNVSGIRNLARYDMAPIDWERVRDTLASDITQAPDTGGPNRHTPWLTTINPDGSPHLTPVGFQLGGVWYFTSGPGTRKSRNVASDPRCVVSVATHPFDLVIEGSAARVIDADELRSVADEYVRVGWPAQVEGDAMTAEYSAPSAGPPPWHVYKITPSTVFVSAPPSPTAPPDPTSRDDF